MFIQHSSFKFALVLIDNFALRLRARERCGLSGAEDHSVRLLPHTSSYAATSHEPLTASHDLQPRLMGSRTINLQRLQQFKMISVIRENYILLLFNGLFDILHCLRLYIPFSKWYRGRSSASIQPTSIRVIRTCSHLCGRA